MCVYIKYTALYLNTQSYTHIGIVNTFYTDFVAKGSLLFLLFDNTIALKFCG